MQVKGWQTSLDRYVAIKILPKDLEGTDANFAARLKQEAKTMAPLSHPGIVPVHDAGETASGLLYFVMEFIEGTDVARMVKDQGRLDPAHALAITAHVCDALAYAHEHGVIHRDIKPANVMLNQEGQVKVADFGLAKSTELGARSGLTKSSMGTPDYVAPEALIGGIVTDHRADLYAVGVMLYHMLTGEMPRGRFRPASEKAGSEARFDAIVEKAMETKRERRYQSAREIRRDLDVVLRTPMEAVKTEAGLSSPASFADRAGLESPASVKKSGTGMIAAMVGAVAVIGLGAFFMFQKPRASFDPGSGGLQAPTKTSRDSGKNEAPSSAAKAQAASTAVANAPLPANATKDAPFVNTLGMKFVPVPILGGATGGQRVLFSVWDTRVQDYEVFARETRREWKNSPGFEQGPTLPAVLVSLEDAQVFCQWLTAREQSAGKLGANERYRLPSDHEWSCAVEIGAREDAAKLPSEKHQKLTDVFPWGTQWPPPKGAGNYAGEELEPALAAGKFSYVKGVIEGYNVGFVTTSPVGSFAANRFGLYDVSGNVWQWCEDWFDKDQEDRVLRGGSWHYYDRGALLSSYRNHRQPDRRNYYYGFRCVVSAVSAH